MYCKILWLQWIHDWRDWRHSALWRRGDLCKSRLLWSLVSAGNHTQQPWTPNAPSSRSAISIIGLLKARWAVITAHPIPSSSPPPHMGLRSAWLMCDTGEEGGLWFQVCMAAESTPASWRNADCLLFLFHACCRSSSYNIWKKMPERFLNC